MGNFTPFLMMVYNLTLAVLRAGANPLTTQDPAVIQQGNVQFEDPVIDYSKGYFLQEVGDGVFWITDGGYHAMAVKHATGLVVVDAPAGMAKTIGSALEEISTDLPVSHLIYSHHHTDHIGAANAVIAKSAHKCDVQIIGHEETRRILAKRKDPTRPVPTTTFSESHTLNVGGKEIQMKYQGPMHTPGNIYVYLPQDKVLMCVDVLYAGWSPFINMAVSEDMAEFLSVPKFALDNFDFKILIAGHFTRLANRKDVHIHKEYLDTTLKYAKEAVLSTDYMAVASKIPDAQPNSWKVMDAYYDQISEQCAQKVIAYWKGRELRGVPVWAREHCFVVALSQQIDIGLIESTDELNN